MSPRAIQQAPFRVLVGANMPAVLVEMGFITNPAQEKQLQSDEFQNLVVQALVESIVPFPRCAVEHASDGGALMIRRTAIGALAVLVVVALVWTLAAIAPRCTGALIPGGCVPACRGGACRSRAKNQSDAVSTFQRMACRCPASSARCRSRIRSPNRRAGSSRRS